jgi:predicted DNA-binding transcriptional regulator AlpA
MNYRSIKPRFAVPQRSLEIATPDSLKISAAAEKIGCSEKELRKMINRGEGPAFMMIGSTVMIRQLTIDKWMVKREAQSLAVLRRNRALVKKFGSAPARGQPKKA